MRSTWQLIFLALLAFALSANFAGAHPMPDVLVRSFFNEDGSVVIRIELDPRAFAEDPLNEPYTENWMLKDMEGEERAALVAKAEAYVKQAVELRFLPKGKVEPELEWRFTAHDDGPLEKVDDPVMLTGEWNSTVPPELEGYQVHAPDYRDLSVYFLNHIRDEAVERYQVMFPGETSYVLDLKEFVAGIESEESAPDLESVRPAAESDPESVPASTSASTSPSSSVIIPLAVIAAVIPLLMFAMILLKRKMDS